MAVFGKGSQPSGPHDEINNEFFVFFVSFCSKLRTTPWTCYSSEADRRSGVVIGAAIELHRIMGQGLMESIKLFDVPLGFFVQIP